MRFFKLLPKLLRPAEPVDFRNLSTAADVLQDNPAYLQAREDILRDIVEQWLGSQPNEKDKREGLYIQAYALSQIDTRFNLYRAHNAMKAKE